MEEQGNLKKVLLIAASLRKPKWYYFQIKNDKLYSYLKKEADICKDEI